MKQHQVAIRLDGHPSTGFFDINMSKKTVQISVIIRTLNEPELIHLKRNFAKCSSQEITPLVLTD